jgi:hypothetical protein
VAGPRSSRGAGEARRPRFLLTHTFNRRFERTLARTGIVVDWAAGTLSIARSAVQSSTYVSSRLAQALGLFWHLSWEGRSVNWETSCLESALLEHTIRTTARRLGDRCPGGNPRWSPAHSLRTCRRHLQSRFERKSLLSALYGIRVANHTIDLSLTLEQLQVNDTTPQLSVAERTATIEDLLKLRSGVYHVANYEGTTAKEERPLRGTMHPGRSTTTTTGTPILLAPSIVS